MDLRCAWCGDMNHDIGIRDVQHFYCEFCKKHNKVVIKYETRKLP